MTVLTGRRATSLVGGRATDAGPPPRPSARSVGSSASDAPRSSTRVAGPSDAAAMAPVQQPPPSCDDPGGVGSVRDDIGARRRSPTPRGVLRSTTPVGAVCGEDSYAVVAAVDAHPVVVEVAVGASSRRMGHGGGGGTRQRQGLSVAHSPGTVASTLSGWDVVLDHCFVDDGLFILQLYKLFCNGHISWVLDDVLSLSLVSCCC